MPTTYTPIRYPGGKSRLYPTMRAIMESNGMLVDELYGDMKSKGLCLTYSANRRIDGSQRIILGPGMRWP